ncbi:sensor histidine kinase [Magnetococcus sp. PR-3]|uniref:sensor histidine kinase n=1 Tax=Magnetococcus sp. PR-3 TaxID=3120355 RepID=UPI002FCDEEA9
MAMPITIQDSTPHITINTQPSNGPEDTAFLLDLKNRLPPLPNRYLNQPIYTNGVLQIPIQIIHQGDIQPRWLLTIFAKRPKQLSLFRFDHKKGWQPVKSIKRITPKDGATFTHIFEAPLDFSDHKKTNPPTLRIYELQVHSRWTTPIHAELTPLLSTRSHENEHALFYGLFLGLSFTLILLILLVGGIMRAPTFRLHALFLLTLFLSYSGSHHLHNPLNQSLPPQALESIIQIGSLLNFLTALWLWDHLLGLKHIASKWHLAYRSLVYLSALLLPAWLMVLQTTHTLWVDLLQILSIVLFFGTLFLAWRIKTIAPFDRLILLSSLPLYVGMSIHHTLIWGGIVFSHDIALSFALGWIIHLSLIFLIMALQLKQINDEKLTAQHQTLLLAKRSEAQMENVIRQRTQDLANTIEDLKQAKDQALQAMLQERSLQREQNQFITMLSKEFHAPLKRVQQKAEQIHHSTRMDTKSHERLFRIQENTARLGRLIDRFISSNPMKQGVLTLDQSPVQLGQLIHNTLARMDVDLYENRLVEHLPDQEMELLVDREMMEVALRNVLLNALRYSPKSKKVTLSVLFNQAQNHVMIEVQDQGKGMHPHELKQLGEMFYRTNTTQHLSGSGLGLFIVRRIVEAHGGSLIITSQPNLGTQVRFQLPIHAESLPKIWNQHQEGNI